MLTSEKQSIKKNYLRYAEYYDMTDVFDKLYADSLNGKEFTNLCSIISCRDNILLAYRTIKRNGGSDNAFGICNCNYVFGIVNYPVIFFVYLNNTCSKINSI